MYEAFFTPDQQAAIRALLPTGDKASAEAVALAMHTLGELAALEATSPCLGYAKPVSYKQRRDDKVRFMEMTRAYAQAIIKNRTPPRTPEADWYTLILRGLGHVHAETVEAVADLDVAVKENSGRKDSQREKIYTHVLHVWTSLGGSLYLSHRQARGTTTGPVIPYLGLALSLIFDEPVLSDNTLIGIVRRIRKRAAAESAAK
jgi:hypothetical protein